MLTISKLNSIESTISKAPIDNEINHADLTTIINEEKTVKISWAKRKHWNNEKSKKQRINK